MRLRCTGIREETLDVRTYTFEDETGAPIPFLPGQAVTLLLDVAGEKLRRTFSIASSAARPGSIKLTVKAHQAGRATAWLHRRLRSGMRVESTAPQGRFVLPDPPPPLLALVSAGSGATPLMAMLRTLADTGAPIDVAWVHAARTPEDVLFGGELAALQRAMPGLAVAVAVARPGPGWFGFRGRVGRRLLSVMAPDLAARDVFCCGPVGFMDKVRRVHAAEGGAPGRFRVEHFAAAPAPPAPVESGPAEGFRIAFGARSFQALPGETILEAAARENVVIPCGCGGGMCGTCRLRLREGRVDMTHLGGLLPEEEAAGWVLACSARPRSDLALETT